MVIVFLVVSIRAFSEEELKPIAYSNDVRTARHEKMIGWVYAKGETNSVIGWQTEKTNFPVAIIHSVTYGRGTNAVFVLKTCEVLKSEYEQNGCMPPGSNKWQNVEWTWYNDATWIESPK